MTIDGRRSAQVMTPDDMKARTKAFGLRVIRLFQRLPAREEARIIGRQLVRSATSVGANYRSACRARSAADFAAKLKIVEEEADEALYWMELLVEAGLISGTRLEPLMAEAEEVISIVVASVKTTRRRAEETAGRDLGVRVRHSSFVIRHS